MATDWRTAGLDPASAALCDYAERLTRTPSAMTREDVVQLRDAGFDDRAIHDAAQVIGYFNYINRMADGLGVDREEWMGGEAEGRRGGGP